MSDWGMILVGVLLTASTAVFVAGEFSLVALDPSTVETRAVAGERRAETVRRAMSRLSTLLSSAQVRVDKTQLHHIIYALSEADEKMKSTAVSPWLLLEQL